MQMPPVDRTNSLPQKAEPSVVATPAAPKVAMATHEPNQSTVVTVNGELVASPDKPSSQAELPNKDWTEVKKKATAEEPPEPPKEPIYKQLMAYLESVWAASNRAVDVAQQVNQAAQAKDAQEQANANNNMLVYSDPKVKRSGKVS